MALDTIVSLPDLLDTVHRAFKEGDPAAADKRLEEENVRILQNQYGAIARRDEAAFAETLAEEVELEILGPPEVPFLGRWQGRQTVATAVWNNFTLLEQQRPEIRSIIAQGDTVVVHLRENGHNRSTLQPYEFECVQILTFRAGKTLRIRELIAHVR